MRWHGKLPIDLGQTFDEIAYQIRRDFNLLIDQASLNLSNNLDWWIEGPASRNYFSSPLFHYCCSFCPLRKISNSKNSERVIVDSKAFCKILKTWINDNGYNLQVFQRPRIDETLIKFYFGGILRTLNSSFKLFLSYMATRNNRISYKKINISQPLILIDTFVLEKSEVKDRYYPGLWENLDPSDKKRTFFVPEFERNTISKIRKTIDILNLSEKNIYLNGNF